MIQEFDPRKSYLAIKANEKMIAFAGFLIRLEEEGETKEGVVKISSFHRPYGGGYLTLTFIVDKGQSEELKNQLDRLCENLMEDSLRPLLGKGFERMVKVSLDSLKDVKEWYLEEINVYFHSIEEREKFLVEQKLIPALESILPCTFDPVEWWPKGKTTQSLDGKEIQENVSPRSLFRKWFGAG